MKKVDRPPIVLTSEVNLISLQKDLKAVMTGKFFFRNSASGIRIITKSTADYKTREASHSSLSALTETNR
jgi:hypothetical protein